MFLTAAALRDANGGQVGAPQGYEAMSQPDNWSSAVSHVGQCHRPALVENSPCFSRYILTSLACYFPSLKMAVLLNMETFCLKKNPHNIIALSEACYLTSLWTASISRATKALYCQAGTIYDQFPATCAA